MVRETVFDDVFHSQKTFRVLLEVLSRPGTISALPAPSYEAPPRGFCPHVLSVLKTLCDHRVSFSLGASKNRSDWARYLEVNLATSFSPIEKADYAVFEGDTFDEAFQRLDRGSLEFPEASTTAFLCVRRLSARFLMRITTSMLCSSRSSTSEASSCG